MLLTKEQVGLSKKIKIEKKENFQRCMAKKIKKFVIVPYTWQPIFIFWNISFCLYFSYILYIKFILHLFCLLFDKNIITWKKAFFHNIKNYFKTIFNNYIIFLLVKLLYFLSIKHLWNKTLLEINENSLQRQ